MNQLKKIPTYLSMALISLVILASCGGAKETTQKKKKGGLITGASITADETFSSITSNIGRLTAMLSGQYVQHNNVSNEEGRYQAWTVNNGKDSVVLYSILVGEPNKVGYWIYHYQVMTSLPDEPIYQAFENFKEVDRDTIKSVFYSVPEDFKVPLEELIAKGSASFETVDLNGLDLSPEGERVTYTRQNPLFFKGLTPMIVHHQQKDYFKRDFYEIRPQGIIYQINTFEKEDDEKPVFAQVDKFIKLGMFRK